MSTLLYILLVIIMVPTVAEGQSSSQKGCKAVDLVFILDSSGSINKTASADGSYRNWELSLEFLMEIVDSSETGTWRFGLVVFGNQARNSFYLNTYNNSDDIKQAILSTKYLDQNTNTSGAIYMARTQQFVRHKGDRPDVPNVIILVSDGNPTEDVNLTIPEALLAHSEGIFIFSVGVTKDIGEKYLREVSSPPHTENSTWFRSPNFEKLFNIVDRVTSSACEVSSGVTVPERPSCPVDEKSHRYFLIAVVSSVIAGALLLGMMSCGCLACSLYMKLSAATKAAA